MGHTRKTCWFLTCGYVDVVKRRVLQHYINELAPRREAEGWSLATDLMARGIEGIRWPGRQPQQYSITDGRMFGRFRSPIPGDDYVYLFCNESVRRHREKRAEFTAWADAQEPPYPYEVILL